MTADGAGRGSELYGVLGVDPDVAADELARAYRRRLRQLHPDTSGSGDGAEAGPRTPPDLAEVQHAYQVLRDPERRARYDARRRAAGAAVPPTATTGRSSPAAPQRVPVAIRVRVRRTPRPEPMITAGPVRVEPIRTRSPFRA